MAALTKERSTKRMGLLPIPEVLPFGMKAATIGYQGGIAVNDAGVAAPGRTATTLIALGVFKKTYNNSGGAANAITAEIECGTFLFGNSSAGDLIAAADVGNDCFIVDDQTVAKTNGGSTRSRAGKIARVTSEGVYVTIGIGV